MQNKVIRSGNVALSAESFGNADDPAVLLIMGAMASGIWWPEEFCRALAAQGRFVMRYDHRDTGASVSSAPDESAYTVEDLADDAMRVLDGYGITAAHLVGMSLGGYLAQLLALKYSERVLTLALIASERLASADPSLPGSDPAVAAYHDRAATLDWADRDAVVEYQVGAWRLLAGSRHRFDEELIRSIAGADFDRTPDLRTSFKHAALQDAHGWIDRMQEIRVPALIVHGTEDLVIPYAHALALHEALPQATLLTLEGTGHELPRGDWPVVVRALERHTSAE